MDHVRDPGFTEFTNPLPVGAFRFLAAPMFHRRERVGHVFVGDKDRGAEFTVADEETLTMFAAQAAPVIANAGAHREERQARADLETLDLVMPGSDGIELMNDIRKTADAPVIFLSVYGQYETVARALDMGAADYLVKPFSPTELAARIRAALRKRLDPFQGEPSAPYAVAGLGIDYALRRVTAGGEPVELTATEYAVLYELAVHAPRTLTHTVLLQRVWGPERVGEKWLERNVVKLLRRKLGDDANNPRYIFTEPRVGYRMGKGEG